MPGAHNWRHRFRERGWRWTASRECILDLLSRTSGHLSAKDVYSSLCAAVPGLGLTTVYRTLELLRRLGIVQTITSGDGQSRYELRGDDQNDHHHHLICTRCGKIIDYRDFVREELELVKKTQDALTEKYDFCVHGHNIEYFGLCEECRRAPDKALAMGHPDQETRRRA